MARRLIKAIVRINGQTKHYSISKQEMEKILRKDAEKWK